MDNREDYTEKCCCAASTATVPTDRVLGKLDRFFAADDYDGAEKHLLYWVNEAKNLGDEHGLLLLSNECIGLYRKRGDRDKALGFSRSVLDLCAEMGLEDSVTMATAYINAATAHTAFGESDKALGLYEKAQELYEKYLPQGDERLGGLYNNMGLAVAALGDVQRAYGLYEKALAVMTSVRGGETGVAITYCNLADLAAKERGDVDAEEQIGIYLEKAMAALDSASDRRDGAYAYACEKCAPTFGYYGYFIYEETLDGRARSIYEGN